MAQIYGLNTDTNLGGITPNDYQSPSQKASKFYVDNETFSLVYDNSVVLLANETTDNLMQGQDWYNINVVISSGEGRTITVDRMAENENRFVLTNTSSSQITYVFDFSGLTQYIFVGDPAYNTGNQQLSIPIPAYSNRVLVYKPVNTSALGYTVTSVSSSGTSTNENLKDDTVALVLKSNSTGEISYLNIDNYKKYRPDLSGYTLKDFVRVSRGRTGKTFLIYKGTKTGQWAVDNYYRLYCDTTADGGFTLSVGNWGRTDTWTVSWTAGDTLESIKSQLADATYVFFSLASGENFIRIRCYCSSSSYNCTLSNNTGGNVEDLSKYCQVNGVQQEETHRVWQGTNVRTLFPDAGFLSANTVQYAKNGYNISYCCGANLTQYKTYFRINGSSSYVAENAVGRMNEAAFNALDGSGVDSQQALYDKYSGSWDAYMEAGMVQIDDNHTNGIEYQSYDNGDTQNAFLASVTTMYFDGSYVQAFPAAYQASTVVDEDFGTCHLPTVHEMAVFMNENTRNKINDAFAVIGGATNVYINTSPYWSVAQYNSFSSWFYNNSNGYLDYYRKCNSSTCRPLAYISQSQP